MTLEKFVAIVSALDAQTVMIITAVTGIASILIAFFVLLTTIVLGIQNHKRNKLSLHPLLRIEKRNRKIKDLDDEYFYEFEVVNYGTGPAIITSNTLFVDGIEKAHNNNQDYYDNIVGKLIKIRNVTNEDIQMTCLMPTSVIGAGVKKILWSVKYNDETSDEIFDIIDSLDVKIEYESIYGNKMVPFDTAKYRKLASPEST